MMANTAIAISAGAPEWVEKRRYEYSTEDKNISNLEIVARDILYKTLDKNMFSKIKTRATVKEIWEKLIQICEGNDETKENKLTVAQQKYESMKMRDGETICVVPEKSNAIIGVVTAGFECLPPSCDGLTGPEDHGPMISPIDTLCGYRGST
ncbi:hypothetical protein F511_35336 [Dorcoceras hygrometricum]|uniref:Uncharacterized protein n=1 Tax=Dorcoceras hygrometricum TaxID=472368 RepID=A0A2Z7CIB5_9LAMI|nr:hypothetical protein F511_35336 [Dorcoceras hygrometricum]